MTGQDSGDTRMPDDPRSDPERAVDALEEKVANQNPERSETEQHADQRREVDAEADQQPADRSGIDPASNDASSMHSGDEPPA